MEKRLYSFDSQIYSENAILATVLEFSNSIVGHLSCSENGEFILEIEEKIGQSFSEVDWELFQQRLMQNELHARLRTIFAPIENEIVQRAFGEEN